MTEKIFTGEMQTLFVVAANVSLNSATFETVIGGLANSRQSASVFLFEHIRYFELFRGQLRNFYPDEASELGDDIANAMLVVWEVDRVMQQRHWAQLKNYIASFSKRTPCPLLLVANLSEGIICASPAYVRRLARDIQTFMTVSFDDTPSKHEWKCLLMRNNLFHAGYFRAHVKWLHSRMSRHPEVHVPPNWQDLKKTAIMKESEEVSSKEILQKAQHIPHMSLFGRGEHRFLDSAHAKAEWYQGVEGDFFIKAFGNGAIGDMSRSDFQKLMSSLARDIFKAESAWGGQEWRYNETHDAQVQDLVSSAKNAQTGGPVCSLHLSQPVRPWEATFLIAQAIPRIRASRQARAEIFQVPDLPIKQTTL